jgi:excisionase family DNA binding protein
MAMTAPDETDLLTPHELADLLRVSVWTVYRWRLQGSGPRVVWVGRHARYRLRDVHAWLDREEDQEH